MMKVFYRVLLVAALFQALLMSLRVRRCGVEVPKEVIFFERKLDANANALGNSIKPMFTFPLPPLLLLSLCTAQRL